MTVTPGSPQPPSSALEAELRQFELEYIAAFDAGDAARFAGLFTKDAVVLNTVGALLRGRTAIEAAVAQSFSCAPNCRVKITCHHTSVLAGVIIVQQGTSRTIRNEPPNGHSDFAFTKVFTKQDGRWLIAVAHFAIPDAR